MFGLVFILLVGLGVQAQDESKYLIYNFNFRASKEYFTCGKCQNISSLIGQLQNRRERAFLP